MPLRCWKLEGSRVVRLQRLVLLSCLLILALCTGCGRTMTDGGIREMRYEQKNF